MKNLKTIILGIALLAAYCTAKAKSNPATGRLTKTEVLTIYMNAAAHGKIEGLDKVVANDVEFNIERGEKTITTNKKQMLDFFKAQENIEQPCKCSTTTMEDNDERMVVKFDMKYDDYIQSDIVTIVNKGYAWEITKVDTKVV